MLKLNFFVLNLIDYWNQWLHTFVKSTKIIKLEFIPEIYYWFNFYSIPRKNPQVPGHLGFLANDPYSYVPMKHSAVCGVPKEAEIHHIDQNKNYKKIL